jgi:hypothetical protein
MAFEQSMGTVEYPVAWVDGTQTRHLGRARIEGASLVLDGAAPGSPRRTIRVFGKTIRGVELHRWAPSPAVAVSLPDGDVVVEVMFGGWGAAHQLADTIHGIAHAMFEKGDVMTDQIAIVADIRPGKRADLEHALAEGPPFDLTKEGFEHHEVFLGDSDVVFVFTGPGAASQLRRMAATPDLFRHVIKMTSLLSAPRLLQQTFEWDQCDSDGDGSSPVHAQAR